MNPSNDTANPARKSVAQADVALRWMIFLFVVVLGFAYVKWIPYYQRALFAASHHSIGASILTGAAENPPPPSLGAALDYAWTYTKAIWKALLLGLLVGSAIPILIPPQWISRVLGATGFRSVAMAGLFSVPGMMCTCCAAPVVAGLRARRASPGAAVAFWLGNTMLNPATLVFMGFVLGWHWSLLRVAFGLLMVFGLGRLIDHLAGSTQAAPAIMPTDAGAGGGEAGNVFARWAKLLLQMAVGLIPEYLVLVLLLGATRAWLFPHIGPDVGNELMWIVAFAVAGSLFVIPTAGEVPIVQSMLLLGVGAGPAAALLVTLPPISVPSLAMLAPSFPLRVLALVAVSVVALGVLASFAAISLGF